MQSCWRKLAHLPKYTLDELTHFTNAINTKSDLDEKLVHFVLNTQNSVKGKFEVKIQYNVSQFTVSNIKDKCVYIIREDTSSFAYGILYKKLRKIFYKNVKGEPPSEELKKILDQTACHIRTNDIYDGFGSNEYLMVLKNCSVIAKIAADEKVFSNSVDFAKSENMKHFEVEIIDALFQMICKQIDTKILQQGLSSNSMCDSCSLIMRAIIAISKHVDLVTLCDTIQMDILDIQKLLEIYANNVNNTSNVVDLCDGNVNIAEDQYIYDFLTINNQLLKDVLIEHMGTIKLCISELKGKTLENVKQWAIEQRNKPKTEELTAKDLKILIAWCIYAMQLQKNLKLRDVQILAIVLVFIDTQHVFLEIKTGEGKTFIIAIVAAVKVLMGYKVDVLTSNDLLAYTNSNEMKDFFEILNISCASNCINKNAIRNNSYSKDIVYGSIAQFQFDYLQNVLKVSNKSRADRPYKCCILDEVDLLIDNSKQLAKLAKPFPGMEALTPLYQILLQNDSNDVDILNTVGIPKYLESYCNLMIPKLKENASNFTENFKKDIHYVIQNRIIPVDYKYTGCILHNSVFSEGIQQFLELKHLKKINRVETINSVFISNFGFVKKYQNHLVGVTGTLGLEEEMNIFSEMFNESPCAFYNIPTFRKRDFNEENILLAFGWEWNMIKHAIQLLKNKSTSNIVFLTTRVLCNKLQQVLRIITKEDTLEGMSFCTNNGKLQEHCKNAKDNVTLMIPLIERNTESENVYGDKITKSYQSVTFIDENSTFWSTIEKTCCIEASPNDIFKLNVLLSVCEFGHAFSSVDKDAYAQSIQNIINEKRKTDCTLYIYDYEELCTSQRDNPNVFVYKEARQFCDKLSQNKDLTKVKTILLIRRDLAKIESDTTMNWGSIDWDDLEKITSNSVVAKLKYSKERYVYPTTFYKPTNYHLNIIRHRVESVIRSGKPVLVICENVSQVLDLHRKLRHNKNAIFAYTDNINNRSLREFNVSTNIQPSQIILTTNIGGRGTDFKISPELAATDGLYVINAFLSINERVEDQAYGRTARNGNIGYGQIIIDALKTLMEFNMKDIDSPDSLTYKQIKSFRNDFYRLSLQYTKKKIEHMYFNDNLCTYYINFYKHLQEEIQNKPDMNYILDDINERWAFWLLEENHNMNEPLSQEAAKKFESFRQIVKGIIESNNHFNPIYAVKKANYYLKKKEYKLCDSFIEKTLDSQHLSDSVISECFLFILNSYKITELQIVAKKILDRINVIVNRRKSLNNNAFKDWTPFVAIVENTILQEDSLNSLNVPNCQPDDCNIAVQSVSENILDWWKPFQAGIRKYINQGKYDNWLIKILKLVATGSSKAVELSVTDRRNPNSSRSFNKVKNSIEVFLKKKIIAYFNQDQININDTIKTNTKLILSRLIELNLTSQKRITFDQLDMIFNKIFQPSGKIAKKLKLDCKNFKQDLKGNVKENLSVYDQVEKLLTHINREIEKYGSYTSGIENLPEMLTSQLQKCIYDVIEKELSTDNTERESVSISKQNENVEI